MASNGWGPEVGQGTPCHIILFRVTSQHGAFRHVPLVCCFLHIHNDCRFFDVFVVPYVTYVTSHSVDPYVA